MKILYTFNVKKEEIVEKVEKTKEGDVEVEKKTKVKELVDKKYFLKKPVRKDFEAGKLFYGVKLADGVRDGLLTRSMLIKRFSDDGGILSPNQKDKYSKLYADFFIKQNQLQKLLLQDVTKVDEKEKTKIESDLLLLRNEIQDFETSNSSIFENTAENVARDKTILWWVLHLAFKEEDGKELPFFDGNTYNEKLDAYDVILEKEDEHLSSAKDKFFYFTTIWYINPTIKLENFQEAERLLNPVEKKTEDKAVAEKIPTSVAT